MLQNFTDIINMNYSVMNERNHTQKNLFCMIPFISSSKTGNTYLEVGDKRIRRGYCGWLEN